MKVFLPDPELLQRTGEVDYYQWNYTFPISLVQRYRFKRIVELLGKIKYSQLLEIGTGSGIFLPELSRHCSKLYACDIHNNYGHIAELLGRYEVTNCEVSCQNIEATDYPDSSFDAIVAVSVLEFVKNVGLALQEIKRIMKPNGVFITICPMQSKVLDTMLSFYSDKKPEREFRDSRRYITKQLEENFRIISKGQMLPVAGKWFPVYTHYKLGKR